MSVWVTASSQICRLGPWTATLDPTESFFLICALAHTSRKIGYRQTPNAAYCLLFKFIAPTTGPSQIRIPSLCHCRIIAQATRELSVCYAGSN